MPYILEGVKNAKLLIDYNTKGEPWTRDKDLNQIGDFRTKVVADGGITTISRAIKALALGADYVMMGRVFAECKEACGVTIDERYKRMYYGQSSKEGQMDRFGKIKANPEGTAIWVDVTTNLDTFTTKFAAALRSAMSYCGAHNLEEFIGKVKYEYMSPVEFQAYNK